MLLIRMDLPEKIRHINVNQIVFSKSTTTARSACSSVSIERKRRMKEHRKLYMER